MKNVIKLIILIGVLTVAGALPTQAIMNITFSANPICTGGTCTLGSDHYSGGIYYWYKGTTSTGTLLASGINQWAPTTTAQTATLTWCGYLQAGSLYGPETFLISVNQKSGNPTSATASPTTVCSGAAVTLTLSGGGAGGNETIKWYSGSCGGTLVGTGSPCTVNPTTTTTYYGRYEDGAPCNYNSTCAATAQVTVNALPSTPTASNDGPTCQGGTLHLYATTVSGAVSYSWTGPPGTVSGQNLTLTVGTSSAWTGTYYVRATDGNGCVSLAGSTYVTVYDTPATPTASNGGVACPGGTLYLYASTVPSATYSWTGPNGFSSAAQNPTIPGATTAATGTYYVTATVNGCPSSAGSTGATVADSTPPSITCPANKTVNTDSGQCHATGVALGTPTASDNCGTPTLSNDAPTQYPKGVTTVTWTAHDASGNTATCAQTVTVNDAQPPSITCPANVTVNTDSGQCHATGVALGTPTTSDNCGGSITTANNAPTQFPKGVTTVTWTAHDTSGNTATCAQTVTVDDAQVPTITCPADMTVSANSGCTATNVDLGTPATGDNCSVASVANNAPTPLPLGANSIVWTVTDGSGNTATCTQSVTVRDTTPPRLTVPANVIIHLP